MASPLSIVRYTRIIVLMFWFIKTLEAFEIYAARLRKPLAQTSLSDAKRAAKYALRATKLARILNRIDTKFDPYPFLEITTIATDFLYRVKAFHEYPPSNGAQTPKN